MALNSASAAFFWDATMNVTWLDNMNQQNSTMDWASAMAWADALTTGGFTDWRLPTIIDSGAPGCDFSLAGGTDCGYNVQTQVGSAYSEWAHLYDVTLGNLAYCPPGDATCAGGPQIGWGLTNTAYGARAANPGLGADGLGGPGCGLSPSSRSLTPRRFAPFGAGRGLRPRGCQRVFRVSGRHSLHQ